ncbi:MAG: serine protease [Acidobacteriaceae bacterium]|nr:serine protease [Acidobacteriaceae bacterium]MBV9501461.1 serine protease [Acidobacteriaceae bacterium]
MSSSTALTDLSGVSEALVDLVQRTTPGIVAVKAAPYRVVSGVVLKDDLIAVADHTLRREERVPIHSSTSGERIAVILGRDPSVDLAILRAEGLGASPLSSADPTLLKPGMLTAVVGLTIDVGPSASLGILGAVGGSRRTWRGGTLDHFIRLDVNLYPSQSGAAVVSATGQLIGMATPGLLRHSAVAVPLATIERVAKELVSEGRIRHGYLGVGLQPVKIPANLRSKLQNAQETGLILLSVEADSPAERAGLQIGDILVTLSSSSITDVEDLQHSLRGDMVGRTVPIVLLRGGERVEAQIAVSERLKREN